MLYQRIMDEKNVSAYEIERILGLSNGAVMKAINRNSDVKAKNVATLAEHFPDLGIDWMQAVLLEERLAKVVTETKGTKTEAVLVSRKRRDATRDIYTNRYGVRFEPMTDGTWKAYHKHVPLVAHAAAAAGFGDAEFMDALPEYTTIVNEISEDNYITFTVIGDCQDDNTREAIVPGDEITGRSLSRSMWTYRLPYASPDAKPLKIKAGNKEVTLPEKSKRYKNWIIIDRVKGIRVVVIKDQDVEKGILYCTCRNPDKKNYPDFEVLLDDCSQIFYVIVAKTTF